MLKNRSTKLLCLLIAFVWTTIVIGSSYAYFIDSVEVTGNVIAAGNLKAGLEYMDKSDGQWKDASRATIFSYQHWEPGYTDVQYIRMSNKGDLALQYELNLVPDVQTTLMDVIDVYFGKVEIGNSIQDRATFWQQVEAGNLEYVGTMRDLVNHATNPHGANYGVLLKGESQSACIVLHMQEEAGNEYQNLSVGDGFKVQLFATQYMHEEDSFGKGYDTNAADETFPVLKIPTSMTIQVQPVKGLVPRAVTFDDPINGVSATVPAGAKMADGATSLTLIVSPMDNSKADIDLEKEEVRVSYNVKVDGLASDNAVPVIINMGEVLSKGLNLGNYDLYHVENGATHKMNLVDVPADHNDFAYNPVTGEVSVAMATFSEVALVAETAKWEGNFDYSWYAAAKTELIIANADQLAAFGAIVGGMNGQTQDSFAVKTVKLIADVDLNDAEGSTNNWIFYPIGYYNSEGTYERTNTAITSGLRNFEGTFDGNGHTIANFYHNTWEMKGDNDQYAASLQYYRDGMGLFGKVYGGTVKNLTVENFKSDGEYTTTGVIAAYADGATFENIAITNCNPRVYNIGNGGIVGCVGWYAKEANLTTTFKNITVDNTNKISALWGSWDVACGGLVGQYYPTSGQTSSGSPANGGVSFENCHVSAQIDVYNDVCANYQYYAYRYAGMMIGSIRENETIDGHVYPKMDGITASGCTVHFGTWNDYYYCELVDNTTASYTHDYQMSRLVEIKAINGTTITYLDGTTGTVPTSGRANYVIVDYSKGHGTENADCYHFKDGEVWTHDMGDIQEGIDENGDGKDDLKEDKQHIYLEFNNLFTGYGWGVTSKGLTDFNGIENMDIGQGDHEASVEKFKGKVNELANNTEYKLGDLFNFVDNGVKLVSDALTVTVTNLDENNPVSAEFIRDAENWANGTLTFNGSTGKVKITIQDYYFCTPTTINVTITEREEAVKFETKFTGDFLYRVGNKNTVALSSLFAAKNVDAQGKDDISDSGVWVSIEKVDKNMNVSGTFKANDSDWAKGTIQFTGTGVVKVTIQDYNFCKPTVLYLEVVDAQNITTATGSNGTDVVLLSTVNASNYVSYQNCTLYGNGFTYTLNGAPTNYKSGYHGVLTTNNATLDNLVIVGDIYDEYGAYTNNNDYNAAVGVQGYTVIQNCYISGCSAPVWVNANATIKNTTLYGGAVANLIIKGGTVTLENVTTANFNDNREFGLIGMGIVFHKEASDNSMLVLNGTLTQYNFINEADVPTEDYAEALHAAMFTDDCKQYHFGTSPKRYVNTGIISLKETIGEANITDNAKTGYKGQAVSTSGFDGYVYTQPNTNGSVNNGYNKDEDNHVATIQGAIPPGYSFDYTTKNYVAKTEGSNDYCYEEDGTVYISMDDGDTFNWDTSILTATKNGQTLDYTVSMDGTNYTDKSIAFNTEGDYEVTYTYTDSNNYGMDENDDVFTYSETYTQTVNINVAVIKSTTKHATFTFADTNAATEKITVGNNTYISAKGVSATEKEWGYITVDGTKIFYPITEAQMKTTTFLKTETQAYYYVFKDTVTITDYEGGLATGTVITYNENTKAMPSNLKVENGMEAKYTSVNSACVNITKLTKTGNDGQVWNFSASSKEAGTTLYNNHLAHYSPSGLTVDSSTRNYDAITVAQFCYTDNAGTPYYYFVGYFMPNQYSSGGGCVTPDTLVTLADGSKKEIQYVTYEDRLLVWDFYKGEYAAVPSAIIFNHGVGENTVIAMAFDDGTVVKVTNMHLFVDADTNSFVMVDEQNAHSYIGHSFVKRDGNGYKTVKLVDVDITQEIIGAYGIISAGHYNILVEDMFSADYEPQDVKLFTYFDIGDNMKFDEQQMQADIEKYGLYTYEEFADYLTPEQFEAFNVKYMKVAVGKGEYTYEGILQLIEEYLK